MRNDEDARWELRATWRDEPRQRTETRVIAWVTDEMMTRVANPVMLAVRLHNSIGTVPPPLAAHLPAYDPGII